MDDERALTAYCGLYCRDCIPSNERLSAALAELQSLVEDLNLARYAELLAKYKARLNKNGIAIGKPQTLPKNLFRCLPRPSR